MVGKETERNREGKGEILLGLRFLKALAHTGRATE